MALNRYRPDLNLVSNDNEDVDGWYIWRYSASSSNPACLTTHATIIERCFQHAEKVTDLHLAEITFRQEFLNPIKQALATTASATSSL